MYSPQARHAMPVSLLVVALMFGGLIAASSPASAQTGSISDDCFFPAGLERVYLYAPGSGDPEFRPVAAEVRAAIEALSDDPGFSVTAIKYSDAVISGPNERTLIIDSDLGIPGEPQIYAGLPDTSLFVHWATAADDVRLLLSDCQPASAAQDQLPEVLAFSETASLLPAPTGYRPSLVTPKPPIAVETDTGAPGVVAVGLLLAAVGLAGVGLVRRRRAA